MDFDRLLAALPEKVNQDEMLAWRGRHLSTVLLLQIGQREFLLTVQAGRVVSIQRGPFVMPSWKFALRADEESWAHFWQPVPAPGYHDVMALAKSRRLRMEGDLHPLMSNLLYFKALLQSIRLPAGAA